MGGLAAGSLLAGRSAAGRAPARALRLYAALEAAIGAWALALPWLLARLDPLLSLAYRDGGGGAGFALARVAVGFLLVAAPAGAMGATFPLAVRWMARDPRRHGSEAGTLYAANTCGAVAGAALAGFVLLPAIGLRSTTLVGVALNGVAALAAAWIARGAPLPSAAEEVPARAATVSRAEGASRHASLHRRGRRPGSSPSAASPAALSRRPSPRLAALGLAVSGFVALVHEVTWTRVLVLVLGPTSWAFSGMLVSVIGGLALGSAAGAWLSRRSREPIVWLACALGVVCAAGGVVPFALNDLPLRVAAATVAPGATLASVVSVHTLLAALLLLPLTAALGAAFPLGLAAATDRVESAPRDVAGVYAANTAGAIAGSLLAGFVLIPALGLRGAVVAAAAVALAGAWIVAAGAPAGRRRLAAAALAACGFVFVAAGPRWDVELLSAGAYKYAPYVSGLDVESALKAGEVLFHSDGAAATVTVKRTAGTTTIAIDGKIDASNGGDMLTQKLLGHLPLMLHPAPRRVCVVGLGSGVTVGAVLRHPVSSVDVLEISPAVVRASEFFTSENHDALRDPRTRLVIGDGRTHLALSSSRYDVVVSEPSNPWVSGMAALFTREFFESVRRRLQPGGLFCQWAHAYDMSDRDLRSIVATFLSVFPDATMWLGGESDLLLIGGDPDDWAERIERGFSRPGVASDLGETEVRDSFSLASLRTAGAPALREYAAGAALQTDDRVALEYTAPRALYRTSGTENRERLRALAAGARREPAVAAIYAAATARNWTNRGRMLEKAEAIGLAGESFEAAAALDAREAAALEGLARTAPANERSSEAAALLERLADADPANVPARLALSKLLAVAGRLQEAIAAARQAQATAPLAPEPAEQLASLYADAGAVGDLEAVVATMQARHPGRADTWYYSAVARFLWGDLDGAARMAAQAVAADPRHARAWSVAAAAHASLGQVDAAREAFRSALALAPRDATTRANLGLLELNAGLPERAGRLFAEALSVEPGQPAALAGLAEALERQGHEDRAAALRRKSGR
jgi:spermidine synthase